MFLILLVIILLLTNFVYAYDYEKSINNTMSFSDNATINITTVINDTLIFYSNETLQYINYVGAVILNDTDNYIFNVSINIPSNINPINITQYIFVNSTLLNTTVKNISLYFNIFNGSEAFAQNLTNITIPEGKTFEMVTPKEYIINLNTTELPFTTNYTLTVYSKEIQTLTVYCDPFLICPSEFNLSTEFKNMSVGIEVPKGTAPGTYDRRLIFLREGNTSFIHFKFYIVEPPPELIYYNKEMEQCMYDYYYSEFTKAEEERRFKSEGQARDFCFAYVQNKTRIVQNITEYINQTVEIEVLKYSEVKDNVKEAVSEVMGNYKEELKKEVKDAIKPDLEKLSERYSGLNNTIEGLMEGQHYLKEELTASNTEKNKLQKYKTGFWVSFWFVLVFLFCIYIISVVNYNMEDA